MPARPFLLAHLSDPHIGGEWADADPVAGLLAAVEAIRAGWEPDAVLVSGDLADHGTDDEYEQARELLDRLGAPLHVLPGNHDDRAALRRHFDVPGDAGEPIEYAVDLGPLRLVVADTTIPGEAPGALDAERLQRLDARLSEQPDQATLVAMHHPPITVGIRAWDEIALADADRRALGDLVARHRQVRRIVGGHLHREITADLAGRPVMAVPSTYVQAKLDFTSDEIQLSYDPPGFALHAVLDGALVSHVQPVG